MTPIIQSLLDTDLYKFTMLQVMLHQFPQAHSVYEFRCRNETTVYPLADIREDFERELEALCMLRFQDDELDYLRRLRFIKSRLFGTVSAQTPFRYSLERRERPSEHPHRRSDDSGHVL